MGITDVAYCLNLFCLYDDVSFDLHYVFKQTFFATLILSTDTNMDFIATSF